MARKQKHTSFAVLGLGRFGMSIVQTLSEYDVNILACDMDPAIAQAAAEYATHVVSVDLSDESALARLELGNFDVVILAMGEVFEASVMATMVAKESGAKRIIVKARNQRQKKILQSIGADDVILPELEMGAKLARSLAGSNIMDILEDSEFYAITEMRPMEEWVGKTIRQADIRRRHDITVLATRRGRDITVPISPDKVITAQDALIVFSKKQ